MPHPVALGGCLLQYALMERRFRACFQNYDIYHEAGCFPLILGRETRTVQTIHDLSLLLHPEWHPKETVVYWRIFFKKKASQINEFCAVSEFTRQEMIHHLQIDPSIITVTPLGVDLGIF